MSRSVLDLRTYDKPWVEQVEAFVSYYQYLVDEKGDIWLRGLHVAHRWLEVLSATPPDITEARLIVKVLEAERLTQGTAWSDMYFRLQKWIAEVEPV